MSRSFPWDSRQVGIGSDGYPIYDRSYDAQDLRDQNMAHFTNGVVRSLFDEMQCTHDSSGTPMSVDVAKGVAEVQGSTFINDGVTTLTIEASDPQPRIDTVVIRFDKSLAVRDTYLDVVKGTPSSNPVRPVLTRDDTVWEIGIADVFVNGNVTSVSSSDISMTIDDTGRCGWSGSHADENVGLKAYPVGALYLSFVATSPAELFGGSWTQITGRFLRAASDTNTGGADSITLTTAQMPSHNHAVRINRVDQEATGYGLTVTAGFAGRVMVFDWDNKRNTATTSTGSTQSHSNVPSYQDVYVWRRTA